ncbi:uncharacterized protein [Bemisia tabaci]|uniref:uncharacterized protein n=1 Tax=Bemisia tabaci TaxID=7038 RepID=UPI003B28B994
MEPSHPPDKGPTQPVQSKVLIPERQTTEQQVPTNTKHNETLYYNHDCHEPFIVHISKNDSYSNSVPNLHPLQISRLLKSNQVQGVTQVAKQGRNIVKVTLKTARDANSFVANFRAKDPNYNCFIPKYRLLTKGVIRDIPIEFTETELAEMIISSHEIYAINRMYKYDKTKKEKYPIPMISVTFIANSIPNHVMFDYFKAEVKLHIKPVTQCNNCMKFGHISKFCRGKKTCRLCGLPSHENECAAKENIECPNCKEAHAPTDVKCPERIKQAKINGIIAENNISYSEAKSIVGSYSDEYKFGMKKTLAKTAKSFPNLGLTNISNKFSLLEINHLPPRFSTTNSEPDPPKKPRNTQQESNKIQHPSKRKSNKPTKRKQEDFPTAFVNKLKQKDSLNERLKQAALNNTTTAESDNSAETLMHVSAFQEVHTSPVTEPTPPEQTNKETPMETNENPNSQFTTNVTIPATVIYEPKTTFHPTNTTQQGNPSSEKTLYNKEYPKLPNLQVNNLTPKL